MLSAYIHIPFCVSKCHYCDFNSVGLGKNAVPEVAYLQDLKKEPQAWCQVLPDSARAGFSTVFFGGGTPSLFSPEAIAAIFQELNVLAPLEPNVETTLELNPKTADFSKMRGFRRVGIGRLSIGVQTLEEELLKPLARAHSAAEALQALEWAFEAEFPQINLDLMYALPEQDLSQLQSTLKKLERFPLRHLSAYELIWEEGTPFYDLLLQGRLSAAPEDSVLQMHREIHSFARDRGMHSYEVSNFSAAGNESRHNLHYWDYDSFIGWGAGAVSFLRTEEISAEAKRAWGFPDSRQIYGVRLTRPKPLAEYSAVADQLEGFQVEWIDTATAAGEFMMMGLRKISGIRFEDFAEKFSFSFPGHFQERITNMIGRGWMWADSVGCGLTETGMLVSNEVLQGFLPEG